jgi:hypothetical protein
MIKPQHIRKIKTLTSKLKLSDDAYRGLLTGFGVSSCKELEYRQALELIDILKKQAIAAGVWKDYTGPGKPLKFAEYDSRPEPFATGKQLRMIDAAWKGVSRQRNEKDRGAALDALCKRIVGIDKLIWIHHDHVSKVYAAIKAMKSQQNKQRRPAQKEQA